MPYCNIGLKLIGLPLSEPISLNDMRVHDGPSSFFMCSTGHMCRLNEDDVRIFKKDLDEVLLRILFCPAVRLNRLWRSD